jgi:ribonuclease Z
MAQRAGAKYLMLTRLILPLGARQQGPYKVPGGTLTKADYRKAAEAGGFSGNTVVRTDLGSVRVPAR